YALFRLQGPASHHPVVLLNAFAQVLVVSTAEVLVCWALVARGIEAALRRHGKAAAYLAAAAAASALFGLYHFAHSPPFDTWPMVALLGAVGLATSLFFFASRDVAATVVFHNFLALYGVTQALAASGALAAYEAPRPALLAMAALALALLAAAYPWLRHAGTGTTRKGSV
ncbi:MAG TPA: CPBP family glutamic-type intramembrane protease, partial [Myxococcota bacterium]|nr:CPBP family glutamic-type intramembrane protease [Myxococcota bacterium]